MNPVSSALVRIAVDLTRSLGAADRYERLLKSVRSVLPCDATALLVLRDGELLPLAAFGLRPQVLGMRFRLAEHPRLARIVASDGPVRFPSDSSLPDPFDGLVDGAPDALNDVHDCLGCPLVADGSVVGVLTADALVVDAFDGLDREVLLALGALAGAALHTSRLIETIESLAERRGHVVRELTREISLKDGTNMLGVSHAMTRLRAEIQTVASSDLAVLIVGETGVGKELVAGAVHAGSSRSSAPLIHVNCAALPESVVESELFGHVRGAFTGASSDRLGKFEVADGGTLFLDEIGELPLSVQPKLLRALQEGEIQRVGSDRPIRVDVRVVAATNRSLEDEVETGHFRADLYHRLNVYPIQVPPLRERPTDVPILAGFFLDRYRARLGLGPVVLAPGAVDSLRGRRWRGNVRELDHVLARAALRVGARTPKGAAVIIEESDLDSESSSTSSAASPQAAAGDDSTREAPFKSQVDEFKRELIARTLATADGNWAEAGRRLGMDRGNLHHLARRLGLR